MASNALRFLDLDMPVNYSAQNVSILDKEGSKKQYVAYMLDRTNRMFSYQNLPSTIPAYMLELYLQTFGYAAFVQVDKTAPIHIPVNYTTPSGLYIFYGGIGGERDIYYRPKTFTAANPRLKESIQSPIRYPGDPEIKDACVIMANDRNYMGLLPLFNRYAAQLTENDISIRSAQINARAQVGISTSTDRDRESAQKYLDNLEAGKLGTIGETAFLDGISVANVSTMSSNTIIQLIELQQYLKASWFNELGLNVNFNMKREYMSEEEIAVNTDILLPLVDDMYECRCEAVELINDTFNLNIKVEKSSAWANKELEDMAALSESANKAGIPLNESARETIYGSKETVREETQEVVSGSGESSPTRSVVEAAELDNQSASEEQNGSGTMETQPESISDSSPTEINISINVATEGSEIVAESSELESPESETLEKSEESSIE